mgnify:CR=1 FL=1
MDEGIKGEMKREQRVRKRECRTVEGNRVRGKWEGEIKRENEKETEGGLRFVYLLYTKRLLNLVPLTPPWQEIACNDNIIYMRNNTMR